MNQTTYLENACLLAMPTLQDPAFFGSVTYLCNHNADGALGFIINTPATLTFQQICDELALPRQPLPQEPQILFGGPVAPNQLFVLHDSERFADSSLRFRSGYTLTTSKDILEAIAIGQGPARYLITLGYAGWGAGQLEQEISQNAWLHTPAEPSLLFEVPTGARWDLAAKRIGISSADNLSHQVGHA